jgi:hypothetical protein
VLSVDARDHLVEGAVDRHGEFSGARNMGGGRGARAPSLLPRAPRDAKVGEAQEAAGEDRSERHERNLPTVPRAAWAA